MHLRVKNGNGIIDRAKKMSFKKTSTGFLYKQVFCMDFHKFLKAFSEVRESYRHFSIFNNITKKFKCPAALFLQKTFSAIKILKKIGKIFNNIGELLFLNKVTNIGYQLLTFRDVLSNMQLYCSSIFCSTLDDPDFVCKRLFLIA